MVADLGQTALVQSNHAVLNGALAHRKACQEHGIIPIVGVEGYWRPDRRVREKEWRYRRWHIIFLAKNLAGWHNIIRLTSEAHASGYYQSPAVDWELMEEYSEGIICTTSCILGPLSYLIQNGTDRQVDEWVDRALKIYGDDLFFSVMPHDFDSQRSVNLAVASLAAKYGCPVVHEKDSHYPEKGWVDTQKVAILTGMNKTFADAEAENRKRIEAGDEVYELWHDDLHLSSEAEDREMYARCHPDLPQSVVDEAIENTEEILRRVEPYLMDRTLKMPKARGKDHDAKSQVLRWCREGMRRIGKEGDQVYEDRLIYEAEVIDARSAFDYFLLVGDLVRWARSDAPLPSSEDDPTPTRKRPIRLNTRGSAAASLICYLTQISTLDPIAHKFKFERFINPERKSMPDIDVDVASSGRDLVKEYVARTYGRESVADIVAYQHFQPRAALKNVAHAIYGYDSDAFKEVAKLAHDETGVIDAVHDIDLEKIREREPEIDAWSKRYPDAWLHAVRLENAGDPSVLRLSKHAAGVAVVPGVVTDVMPTIRADEGETTFRTAWAETSRMSVVDEIGIVKLDLLGLKGMDQQQMILDAIEEGTGERIDLDALPPLKDPYDVEDEVMDLFRKGLTLGVNQFAGDGVKDFMRRASPDNVVDLTAINAIYRPGPLGSGGHNRYVKHKGGEAYEVHPLLQPIISETFGCLVFQEQVMELFQVLVGYSAGQADDVRKEIDKLNRSKNREGRQKLDKRHDEFINAASAKLGSEEAAEEIWQWILPYTGYAFNRPHSGSYAGQAYQDGWLKTHYAVYSYPAFLTLDEKKTSLYLRESRQFGLSVLPPDINVSGNGFTADREANAIRFGLRGIKGVGDAVGAQILEDRPFADLDDFTARSSRKYSKVNKGARDFLLRVGALDRFGARDDWTAQDRALAEMELLGVSLEPGGVLGDDAAVVKENIFTEQEIDALPTGERVIVGGAVSDLRRFKVKRGRSAGQEGARFKLVLDLDQHQCLAWPEKWAEVREKVESGEMLILNGKKNERNDVIVSEAMLLQAFIYECRNDEQEAA